MYKIIRSLGNPTTNNPSIFSVLPFTDIPRYKADQPDRCTAIKIFINAFISWFLGLSLSLVLDYDRHGRFGLHLGVRIIREAELRIPRIPLPSILLSLQLAPAVAAWSFFMVHVEFRSKIMFTISLGTHALIHSDSQRCLINDGAF